MAIVFLFLFAALFLIWGIVFIVRGIKNSQDEEAAVPISSLAEIHQMKTRMEDLPQGNRAESLSEHVIKENLASRQGVLPLKKEYVLTEDLRSKMESEKSTIKEQADQRLKQMNDKNRELTAENERLNEALNREISSKDAITLSDEENRQWVEAKKQLEQARESVSRLTQENQELQNSLQEKSGKIKQLEQSHQEYRKMHDETLHERTTQIKVYEEKISAVEKQQAELERTKELLGQVKLESQSFKEHDLLISNRLRRMAQKIVILKRKNREYRSHLQGTQEGLQGENQELLRREQLSSEKVKELRENIELVNAKNEQKLNDARREVQALTDQLESLKEAESLKPLQENQVDLRNEKLQLIQERDEARRNFTRIKEFNEHLLEKEKILHYELIKSRAQNLGLERICEDFKEQIESLSKIAA